MFWCSTCNGYFASEHPHGSEVKVGTTYPITVTYDKDYTQALKEIASALDRIAFAISKRR